MKFYFVRHGQSEANAALIVADAYARLTEQGLEQARQTGMDLADKHITQIVCSDYIRAQQTAEVLAGELGIPVDKIQVFPELHERELGAAENQPRKDDISWYYSASDEGGRESGQALLDRMHRALQLLKDIVPEDGSLVVVGHAISGFYLQQAAQGKKLVSQLDDYHQMTNADFVEVNTTI